MSRYGVIVVACLLLVGCGSDGDDNTGLTTDTHSSSIPGESEQIEFLERYVQLPSSVIETEFHIVYFDNSVGRVPGPSDWTIEFAVRIDQADAALWTEGRTPIEAPPEWDDQLIEGWDVEDEMPDFFASTGSTRAIYDDGVVIQRSATT